VKLTRNSGLGWEDQSSLPEVRGLFECTGIGEGKVSVEVKKRNKSTKKAMSVEIVEKSRKKEELGSRPEHLKEGKLTKSLTHQWVKNIT
jgi:hypothetical protein